MGRTLAAAVITGAGLALFSSWADAAGDNVSVAGAGVLSRPAYEGSDAREVEIVPLLSLVGDAWFARSTHGVLEGGARISFGGLAAGVQAAHERGPRGEDPSASIGAHLEWHGAAGPAPVIALVRYRNHLDADRGREADGRVAVGVYEGHGFRAGVFGQATWASKRRQRAYYAVEDSGLYFMSLGAFGSYRVTGNVAIAATVEARRLADDVTESAFVQERTTASVGVGLTYRF